MFTGLDLINRMKIKLTRDKYETVYDGEIEECKSDTETLEQIYMMFNIGKKPDGFNGRSLSVSDIVKLGDKFYFCDSFGFIEINF